MTKKRTIKDSELKQIIAQAEEELRSLLEKSETQDLEVLAKADKEEKKDPEKEESAPAPAADSAPAMDAPAPAPEVPPAAEGIAESPEDSSANPGEAPAELPSEETPGEIAPTMDPAALKAEYCALPDAELKMHVLAAQAALFERAGKEEEASAPEAPEVPAAMKSEMRSEKKDDEKSPEKKDEEMSKSEKDAELASLKKAYEEQTTKLNEQNEVLSKLCQAVKTKFAAPERKAVTSIAHIAKSEPIVEKPVYTKEQVIEKLSSVTKRSSLKKSDRDLINKYCVGLVTVDKIEHLLSDK